MGGAGSGAAVIEMRAMASSLGVMSLWRGAPALVGAAPFQNALLMAGYGAGRRWSDGVEADNGDVDISGQKEERLGAVFVGGCVGGLLQCLVASPAELFKVRRQVQDMMDPKRGRGRSITAGMGATMLRDGLPHGVWFASYEWFKHELSTVSWFKGKSVEEECQKGEKQTMAVPLLSGALAAFTAWAVGYPFDLIKTRIQAGAADSIGEATADIAGRGRWSGETAAETSVRTVRNLYRGFSLKLARAIPASAIGFVVYEHALTFIEGVLGI
uniref:Mitochondrial carrier protein n=1 Tax=Pseudictyota dubia TaxID=2749911 RepID=A0A7R9VV14_9STRA